MLFFHLSLSILQYMLDVTELPLILGLLQVSHFAFCGSQSYTQMAMWSPSIAQRPSSLCICQLFDLARICPLVLKLIPQQKCFPASSEFYITFMNRY